MYNLTLEIEANTLKEMVNASVVPAGYEYEKLLAASASAGAVEEANGFTVEPAALKDKKEAFKRRGRQDLLLRRNNMDLKAAGKGKDVSDEKRAELYFKN